MLAYLCVLFALLGLSVLALWRPDWRGKAGWAATVLLALFAGTRYQTGYDWRAYEVYFNSVQSIAEICAGTPKDVYVLVEPLYGLLNFVVKSFGGALWTIFLLIAVFNMVVIHMVTRRISASQTVMWLTYFGIAYLIAQFAVIRQSAASSFVLIALLFAAYNRPVAGGGFFALAAGFHISTVLLSPILLLRNLRPDWRITATVLGIGFIALLLRVDAIGLVVWSIIDYSPSWLAAKLSFYDEIKKAQMSIGSASLIVFHLAVLATLYLAANEEEKRDRFNIIGIWLCIAVLCAHFYFSTFPSFWNRFMLVSTPWEIAAVYRLVAVRDAQMRLQYAAVAGLFLFSATALVYMLRKPDSLPFIPYQSIAQTWFGDYGTGRERIEQAINEFSQFQSDKATLSDKEMASVTKNAVLTDLMCKAVGL